MKPKLTVTKSEIRISYNSHAERNIALLRCEGIIGKSKKSKTISVYPFAGCVIVRPLFGNSCVSISPSDFERWIDLSPIVQDPYGKVSRPYDENKVKDEQKLVAQSARNQLEQAHPDYVPVLDQVDFKF